MDDATEGAPLGLTPILVVSDAHAAIDFYAKAFGAVEIARISAFFENESTLKDGRASAEIQ